MKVIVRSNSTQADDSERHPIVVELRMSQVEFQAQAHRSILVETAVEETIAQYIRHNRRVVREVECGRG